ncbi:OmpA family protein [Cellulophaga baltica]|uniref:OmpA family protein n=1 Tax=Cellulophaga TaxID=104264 RepID=UPI001C077028|nr:MULTISPECIES: OmpA family protein [Cellulophaga]MBU2995727.1 OmpA family protein [Cellulophaga baltica]MDO6767121.1 OmpA family protein [Cellulophaga sp. 1_MG-2023]
MTKKAQYLLGIILTILVGTYFYWTCCSSCNGSKIEEEVLIEETAIEDEPKATSYPFAFKDGDYNVNVNDNFNFKASSSAILLPLAENVENEINNLKKYLNENTNKAFNITGYYTSSEENKSVFPNLGFARANAVKNYIVNKGIPSHSININEELKDSFIPSAENVFFGPVAYSISGETEDLKDELKALHDQIVADPLVLHFQTGEASINLSTEQRQKIANISRYLDKVDDASCSIIGHTDNQGVRANNIKLGLDRADFTKSYLINNGISEAKITTSSEGPDSPIATNDTPEGRSQNRRTIVTLK